MEVLASYPSIVTLIPLHLLVRVVGAVELEGVESLAEGLAYTPHTLCYAGAWGNLICVNRPA